MRADSMANKLKSNNVVDFWKEVSVPNNYKTSLTCIVDGISGTDPIAELWRQHYGTLFNCIKSDLYKVNDIESNGSNDDYVT